jgi:hypothetical protein
MTPLLASYHIIKEASFHIDWSQIVGENTNNGGSIARVMGIRQ